MRRPKIETQPPPSENPGSTQNSLNRSRQAGNQVHSPYIQSLEIQKIVKFFGSKTELTWIIWLQNLTWTGMRLFIDYIYATWGEYSCFSAKDESVWLQGAPDLGGIVYIIHDICTVSPSKFWYSKYIWHRGIWIKDRKTMSCEITLAWI